MPLGGPQLFILNSELRFPTHVIDKLGAVVFYDGGNVFQSLGLGDIGNYSNTVGFGLRYSTPVGPVRVDIGRNLNPIPGVKRNAVFHHSGPGILKWSICELEENSSVESRSDHRSGDRHWSNRCVAAAAQPEVPVIHSGQG